MSGVLRAKRAIARDRVVAQVGSARETQPDRMVSERHGLAQPGFDVAPVAIRAKRLVDSRVLHFGGEAMPRETRSISRVVRRARYDARILQIELGKTHADIR